MSDVASDHRLLEDMGLRPVINASGYPSRLGGGHLAPQVIEAMAAAARTFVPIAEMQAQASGLIAELVGAEAGCVATGADACLTLAAAACMTGENLAAMDQLPDTSGLRNEIVVHRAHRNAFDHALRAAGARFVEFGYLGAPSGVGAYRWQMEAAFSERTSAAFYVAMPAASVLDFGQFVETAHSRDIPVIVDAAATPLPPANLRRWIELGADLVAYAGGKYIGGPAASGFLAGRRDLVRAATMQQQDAFVHPDVYTLPLSEGARGAYEPPHQGLGRMLKVGREEIAGLMAALRLLDSRDFDAERLKRARISQHLGALVRECATPGVTVDYDDATMVLTLTFATARQAAHVVRVLEDGSPRVFVQNTRIYERQIRIIPHCVRSHEEDALAAQLRHCLLSLPPAAGF